MEVRIGCSGWMYDDWRGRLYPEREPKRRWLELYAAKFDTVEVNSTFYRLARKEAVAGWIAHTPPEFLFAVKASRYLTHVKRLAELGEGIKRFYEPLEPMIEAGRLGPVLWQLPENFHRDDGRPFQSHKTTASWRFVRFHYGARGRAGNYSATELDEWARRIAQWRRRQDVFAYFNNDWRGFAPANARGLRSRLRTGQEKPARL